jgi:arylsulfatase A
MTGMSNLRNYKFFSILDPGERTFGPMMKEAGYATAVAGKWQLYGTEKYGERMATGTHPQNAGFDEYCLWQVDRLGSRYWDPTIIRNGRLLNDVQGKYGPDLFCDFILDFMERKRNKPFFIYYPMALVHNPFEPTPDSADRGSKIKAQNFADMLAYMDKTVGRIVSGLEALGLRENTLLIFTSDNGTNKNITSTWKGRKVKGGKGQTTDAGTHVPLVVSWPLHASKGKVCDDLVDFSDVLPTLAEASGARPPKDLDGMSFLHQIRGRKGKAREWIFCYYHPRPSRDDTQAVWFARDKRYKLYDDGRLYDLEKDPGEKDPLADEAGAEVRAKLKEAIDSYFEDE